MNMHKFPGGQAYTPPLLEALCLFVEQGFAISPTNPPKKDWNDDGSIDDDDTVDLGDF